MRTLGLIVNPIAGMGGAVGLKGTDGPAVLQKALELGAQPRAPERAAATLRAAKDALAGARILTCPGLMGESTVRACGLEGSVIRLGRGGHGDVAEAAGPGADVGEVGMGPGPDADENIGASGPRDTREAARAMREEGVDLLLFAGGDGTARDVLEAIGADLLVLGIPAGVKVHSAVFATSPRAAGEMVGRVLAGPEGGSSGGRAAIGFETREAEVMDIDEEAYRAGRVSARLYGYLRVPYHARSVQRPKARSVPEAEASRSVARAVVQMMDAATLWVIGPGTTTREVMDDLGLEGSLLGVDVVRGGALVARDVGERELFDLVQGQPARILVSPIGGQGYIFGRGNQQISGRVIEAVGYGNVVVIATPAKLAGLRGAPLLVDTDAGHVNQGLAGYRRIITGVGQEIVYAVKS